MNVQRTKLVALSQHIGLQFQNLVCCQVRRLLQMPKDAALQKHFQSRYWVHSHGTSNFESMTRWIIRSFERIGGSTPEVVAIDVNNPRNGELELRHVLSSSNSSASSDCRIRGVSGDGETSRATSEAAAA